MADQSISCPSCGKKIPLTRALRAEIEASLKLQFDETLHNRERELRAKYESRLEGDLQRAQADAAKKAEKRVAQELAGLKIQVKDQAKDLEEARRLELSMRRSVLRTSTASKTQRRKGSSVTCAARSKI